MYSHTCKNTWKHKIYHQVTIFMDSAYIQVIQFIQILIYNFTLTYTQVSTVRLFFFSVFANIIYSIIINVQM